MSFIISKKVQELNWEIMDHLHILIDLAASDSARCRIFSFIT